MFSRTVRSFGLAFASIFLITSVHACFPGYVYNNNVAIAKCEPCAIGYYKTQHKDIECTKCPHNSSTAHRAATSVKECFTCIKDHKFTGVITIDGTAQCEKCPDCQFIDKESHRQEFCQRHSLGKNERGCEREYGFRDIDDALIGLAKKDTWNKHKISEVQYKYQTEKISSLFGVNVTASGDILLDVEPLQATEQDIYYDEDDEHIWIRDGAENNDCSLYSHWYGFNKKYFDTDKNYCINNESSIGRRARVTNGYCSPEATESSLFAYIAPIHKSKSDFDGDFNILACSFASVGGNPSNFIHVPIQSPRVRAALRNYDLRGYFFREYYDFLTKKTQILCTPRDECTSSRLMSNLIGEQYFTGRATNSKYFTAFDTNLKKFCEKCGIRWDGHVTTGGYFVPNSNLCNIKQSNASILTFFQQESNCAGKPETVRAHFSDKAASLEAEIEEIINVEIATKRFMIPSDFKSCHGDTGPQNITVIAGMAEIIKDAPWDENITLNISIPEENSIITIRLESKDSNCIDEFSFTLLPNSNPTILEAHAPDSQCLQDNDTYLQDSLEFEYVYSEYLRLERQGRFEYNPI